MLSCMPSRESNTPACIRRCAARVLAATCLAAAVASSLAASSPGASSTVTVTLDVASATSMSTGGCSAAAARNLGTVLPGTTALTSADCTLGFGSTNDTSMVLLSQLDGGGSTMARPSDGPLDTAWNGTGKATTSFGSNVKVGSVLPRPDGKVWVVGSTNGDADVAVARFLATGAIDTTFDGDGRLTFPRGSSNGPSWAALQPDGKLVITAAVNAATMDLGVFRMNTDGTLDTTFAGDGRAEVDDPAVDFSYSFPAVASDGSILVAAQTNVGAGRVVKLTSSGVADATFSGDGIAPVQLPGDPLTIPESVVALSGGRVAFGSESGPGGNFDLGIGVLTAAGVPDTSFSTDGYARLVVGANFHTEDPATIAASLDETTLVGEMEDDAGNAVFARWRLSDGGLDTTFDVDGMATIAIPGMRTDTDHLLVQPDGRTVYTYGTVTAGNTNFGVMRLRQDGSLDPTFDTDGKVEYTVLAGADRPEHAALGLDGSLYVTGSVANGSYDDVGVIKLRGTPIPDFQSGVNDWLTGGMFGACLRAVGGGATAPGGTFWTADTVDADCADGNADPWRPIVADTTTLGTKVAQSPANSITGTASLRFGTRVPLTQSPGAYVAPIAVTVLAPAA
ncbi:MAG: Hemolysin-type calcium-binding region [Thermoleophilia bacterium]|nr:Hemolysin-type calcium-binding region [Thermoleophilia bacterium]